MQETYLIVCGIVISCFTSLFLGYCYNDFIRKIYQNINLTKDFKWFKLFYFKEWKYDLNDSQRDIIEKLIPLLPPTTHFVGIDVGRLIGNNFEIHYCKKKNNKYSNETERFTIMVLPTSYIVLCYTDSAKHDYNRIYFKLCKLQDFPCELCNVLKLDKELRINLLTQSETGQDFQI